MKTRVFAKWSDDKRPFPSTRQVVAAILRGCKAKQKCDPRYHVHRESSGHYKVSHGNVVHLDIWVTNIQPIN